MYYYIYNITFMHSIVIHSTTSPIPHPNEMPAALSIKACGGHWEEALALLSSRPLDEKPGTSRNVFNFHHWMGWGNHHDGNHDGESPVKLELIDVHRFILCFFSLGCFFTVNLGFARFKVMSAVGSHFPGESTGESMFWEYGLFFFLGWSWSANH